MREARRGCQYLEYYGENLSFCEMYNENKNTGNIMRFTFLRNE